MLKIFVVGCVLLCTLLSVHSFLPDPAHVKDCYHPIVFKYFAVNESIQTGRCSIATCKAAPFDIDEILLVKSFFVPKAGNTRAMFALMGSTIMQRFLLFSHTSNNGKRCIIVDLVTLNCSCDCGPTIINYGSGCFQGSVDYSKDYPACCERPLICV